MWKQGETTWEGYKEPVRVCKDVVRKAKLRLEANPARDIKDNKKGFFEYISSKRKVRANVGSLMNEKGALVLEGRLVECLLCFSLYC